MALAKICGLSTPATVDAALAGGAAFVGFMFFAASPRVVSLPFADHLAAPARSKAKVVAVTVDPDDDFLARLMSELAPDLIQLHGAESPRRVREVAERTGAGVIKAVAVSEAADVEGARGFESSADHLMFDASPPAAATRPGGLGAPFDWTLLAGRRLARPWFLAGGLDPWNVAGAIAASGAPMVDVSSGVERGPGLKDPALITHFLGAVGAP
ncbi:MAG TPA: phosphoribosylanthranilate isomerase [Caulobacteraceae bacterium]|jgi:phosphoribosylanthranilate isomerase